MSSLGARMVTWTRMVILEMVGFEHNCAFKVSAVPRDLGNGGVKNDFLDIFGLKGKKQVLDGEREEQ